MAKRATGPGLTAKQDAFALAYVETGNAAEAYRRAYDVKAATQHSTIYSAASRLLADSKISARVVELQDQAASMSLYTVKVAFEEYEAARQLAIAEANPSAAVSAINGKVKLFGLDQPQRINSEVRGTIQMDVVTNDADAFTRRMAGLAARADDGGTGDTDAGSEGGS
ncbi:MAG: terminase small subunit [Myxococcales bacterium]|nr:terminase small subunit [Myxococcales bacterium]